MKAEPGNIYAIRFPNGVYGACRLIDNIDGNTFLIADKYWNRLPTLKEVAACRDRRKADKSYSGEDFEKWWFNQSIPNSFLLLGRKGRPWDRKHCMPEGAAVLQSAEHFTKHFFDFWRLQYDREALFAESDARQAAARRKAEAQQRARKKTLTLQKLAREKPFAHWAEMWPHRVVNKVRKIFSDAIRELIRLQKKKDKQAMKAVLIRITDELNVLESKEECIETSEREELVKRIDELASLVGLSNRNEEFTGHRDW